MSHQDGTSITFACLGHLYSNSKYGLLRDRAPDGAIWCCFMVVIFQTYIICSCIEHEKGEEQWWTIQGCWDCIFGHWLTLWTTNHTVKLLQAGILCCLQNKIFAQNSKVAAFECFVWSSQAQIEPRPHLLFQSWNLHLRLHLKPVAFIILSMAPES